MIKKEKYESKTKQYMHKKNESISCLFDTKDGKLSDEEYNKNKNLVNKEYTYQ